MLIIPAVDIKAGRCVRLRQGRSDAETVYSEDPVEMARRWEREGAKLLHVVDLDAAFAGVPVNADVVEEIISTLDIPVQIGGGIRSDGDVERYLKVGALRAIVGTAAVENPGWFEKAAHVWPERLALALDAREGMVAVRGWREVSQERAVELVKKFEPLPLSAVIFTDVSRDGMLKGPNLASIATVAEATSIPVIASGGVSSADDVMALKRMDLAGVIVGRALYAGAVSLGELLHIAGA